MACGLGDIKSYALKTLPLWKYKFRPGLEGTAALSFAAGAIENTFAVENDLHSTL